MGAEIVRTTASFARDKIGMTNLVYNMRRFVILERMAEVARSTGALRCTGARSGLANRLPIAQVAASNSLDAKAGAH